MIEPSISIEKVRQHITIVRAQHDLADGETDYGALWKALDVMKASADALEAKCKKACESADLWTFQPADNPAWKVVCRVSADEVARILGDKLKTFDKMAFNLDHDMAFWYRTPEWFVISRR